MPVIGIISEGPTDFTILSSMLSCVLVQSEDEVCDFRSIQPELDETDSRLVDNSGAPGWYQVFETCKSEKLYNAFDFCDYLIVQIDTDVSEEIHFDIPKRHSTGVLLTVDEMFEEVKQKIIRYIGDEVMSQYGQKIFFAICVEQVECWLLPIFSNQKAQQTKTVNCLNTLNRAIKAKLGFTIDPNHKRVRFYQKLMQTIRKKSQLIQVRAHNKSFDLFMEQLESSNLI